MEANLAELDQLAQAYAFLGNSLLEPMSQSSAIGLDPAFWQEFPDFGDAALRGALDSCARWAAAHADASPEETVRAASTEYAKLFVGPPEPAAAPWETMQTGSKPETGFGEATFQMKDLLRAAGMQLAVPNRQYEDHLGIELLYCSICCRKAAEGDAALWNALPLFIEQHPLAWIGTLRADVAHAAPEGYYANLLAVAQALLAMTAGKES